MRKHKRDVTIGEHSEYMESAIKEYWEHTPVERTFTHRVRIILCSLIKRGKFITRARVVEMLGVSHNKYMLSMKADGTKLYDLRNEIRMFISKPLLLSVKNTTKIAHLLQFHDKCQFNTRFREKTGIPPAKWRDMMQEKDAFFD